MPATHPRRRRARKGTPAGTKQTASKPAGARHKAQAKSKNTGKQARRNRWYYDVRQYALLTDSADNILILQLPKEYDATAANTWTLPGGKLEPDDEPGEGLLREIVEETGFSASLLGPCTVARWTSRNSKKLGIFYHATVEGEKPEIKLSSEHQRAIWASKAELNDFPFHRPEMLQAVLRVLG